MASSPLPADPYGALGVSKDADLSAVRSAHRKLALKHHPDRIKDEAQREKGKDEFQKIQQAYEILSDPQRRQRYDDQVRLAELRKEAMMRGPPPSTASTARAYPMRPTPQPAPPARDFNEQGSYFEEVRQPRDAYDYRDPYDEQPPRTTSRKHADYERRPPPPPKASEKSRKPSGASGVWPMAAAMAAGKFKAQAEKIRSSKADEKRSDKEKRRDRTDKASTRRPANFENSDSDSDRTEVRPSMKPSSRAKTSSYFDRPAERPRTSPRTDRARDPDEESFVDEKWERHHEMTKAYIAKAANRPAVERTSSDAHQYWIGPEPRGSGRKSGSDNEKKPGSSKERRSNADEFFSPTFTKSTSSPSNLRAHVEERVPARPTTRERERERERDRDRGDRERERERDRERERGDHRRMMPGLHRAQTTPVPKSSASKKDTAPTKGSNLKHGETHPMHDSGYGSSSSPHTPEMREESPPRSTKSRYPATTSTKYQIVDPEPETEDYGRTPRVRELYDDYGDRPGRRYHHSPEPMKVEPTRESERRKEKPERPRVHTKESSRGAAMMQDFIPPSPAVRRTESGRYEDRTSPRSPHDTPPISRNNSGRADPKLFGEVSPDDRDTSSRYARPGYTADKVNITSRGKPQYSQYEYREPDDRSRFREAPRMTSRRPSVNAY